MFIIPEKVLNQLICSVCSKYLSVKPVKVYRSSIIKCGRCSTEDENDGGVVSLYNNIIENGLFPCVNRFEGCSELMNSSEVAAHEKNCFSRTYKCPICSLENEFSSSLQFLRHYENNHGKEVLEKPAIVTNVEREFQKYFLYKENAFIFIIYLRCDTFEKCFLFNVACLGLKERVEKILQNVKCYFFNDDDKNSERLFCQSENRRCSIFEKNADSFKIAFPDKINFVTLNFNLDKSNVDHFNYIKIDKKSSSIETKKIPNFGLRNKYRKIYLSDEYKKKYPLNRLFPCETKLFDFYEKEVFPGVCYFCEHTFQKLNSFNIFKCSCQHFYCSDCYDNDPYCINESLLSLFEMSKYELLRFYCRWTCGSSFLGKSLTEHEDTCKENCNAQYDLRFLAKKHFSSDLGFTENSFVSRTNVFSSINYDFRTQKQKIFVITRDNFKFVLHSNYENERYEFSVSHDYPTDKYYILFKKKEYDHEIYHFYSSVNNFECYDYGNFSFVVLLKKIFDE